MTWIVFAGPSLGERAPGAPADVVLRPPASCGDIARAVADKPLGIGLIDGYFETRASPWHKEILWALSKGIRVAGAASMGAIRAAEMEAFGMVGIGEIFAAYRDGRLEDDDEIAVLHGPQEVGYAPLSEALVNVRATLAAAQSAGIVGQEGAAAILAGAKALFYKDRTWEAILARCLRRAAAAPSAARFAAWLPGQAIDQKRLDAQLLIQNLPALAKRPFARQDRPRFVKTVYWKALRLHMAAGKGRE